MIKENPVYLMEVYVQPPYLMLKLPMHSHQIFVFMRLKQT